MLQEAPGVMAGNGGGSIVNVPARTAIEKAPGASIRSASQGALESLSRAAAVELAPLGVRVNVIAPGPTRTLRNDDLLAAQPEASRVVMGIICSTPQRRLGLPADVAAAAVYLTSDESRHVTGVVLHVDGGLAAAAAGPA
jgi:NAD(P)-dependent dehydrogenase (short-subunit alcohol dehydrogenase family)